MSEISKQPNSASLGWRICTTCQRTACGYEDQHPESVQVLFHKDTAVILPNGPEYKRDAKIDNCFSYHDSETHLSYLLFDDKQTAENYAERQELCLKIHELALRHDTLEACSTEQLQLLHDILSDPAHMLQPESFSRENEENS